MKYKLKNLGDLNLKGVYQIKNVLNNKIYIGSTRVSFKERLKSHLKLLRRGVHANSYLQEDWNQFGEDNFQFSIIELLEEGGKILDREQFYLENTKCLNRDFGYNIDPEVHRAIRSKETNLKISQTLKEGYASGRIPRISRPSPHKGEKRPEFALKLRGLKSAIAIYSFETGELIVTFRGPLDIQEYTEKYLIPGMKLTPHSTKKYYISKKMVSKYVDTNKSYKGLCFKHVGPLSPEMGIAKWVNSGDAEMPIPSQAEDTFSEGVETTGEVKPS